MPEILLLMPSVISRGNIEVVARRTIAAAAM
jgi:hypothetical protein